MSRYLGPLWKKSRALHFSLLRNKKEFSRGKKRITSPGIHGGAKKRRLSSYGLQLQEKQKVMYGYGWRDKQLKSRYVKAKSKSGDAGTNFLMISELRLDNILVLSGLANTVRFARQLVSYGHFLVDGKKNNIPSYEMEPGQVISLKKEKMKENKIIKSSLEQNVKTPSFLDFNKEKLAITYLRPPLPEELNKNINASLIVEWYNRKV